MPNIFLVEDDRAIAKNLTLLLRSEGFSVIHAPTREEALTALAGDPFDLALIDISLPDGNGFTVYTEIKAAREIPVIFLTASGDEASVVTGLNMGADDYITKPFRPRELVARIKTALRKTGRSPAAFNVCGGSGAFGGALGMVLGWPAWTFLGTVLGTVALGAICAACVLLVSRFDMIQMFESCLLYTSDAADE